MKKIPTIFERDWNGDRSRVVNVPHPDCDWVFAGEGEATQKLDGSCCLIRDGKLYKRRELRAGEIEPAGFEQVDFDAETCKTIGWVPVGDGPEDRWHREAFEIYSFLGECTCELIGPKIQGNPEEVRLHVLVPHSHTGICHDVPREFNSLREWLDGRDIEGLVFHHPDGRMAKIKLRDFGLKREGLTK